MKTSLTSLSSLIVEFHRLYAEFKRLEYLEIAANLGKAKPDTFQEEWDKRIQDGVDKLKGTTRVG